MSEIDFRFYKQLQGGKGAFCLDVQARIGFGEFVALFGRSGAGKTSILRLLSGLEQPQEGYIRIGDEMWLDTQKGVCLPPQKRRIGFVFQHYALFPHLSVYQNICFGLRNKQDRAFANDLVELMDLGSLKDSKISQISGGQAQRVALARALSARPKLLLLDEPFSALDHAMARTLQKELKKIHEHFGLTTLLVSHNMSEIFFLATRSLVLEQGKIVRDGSNQQVFAQKRLSAKITLMGEIIDMRVEGVVCIISVLCHSLNDILQVFYDPIEGAAFSVGEKVLIAQKAFSPMLYKLDVASCD